MKVDPVTVTEAARAWIPPAAQVPPPVPSRNKQFVTVKEAAVAPKWQTDESEFP